MEALTIIFPSKPLVKCSNSSTIKFFNFSKGSSLTNFTTLFFHLKKTYRVNQRDKTKTKKKLIGKAGFIVNKINRPQTSNILRSKKRSQKTNPKNHGIVLDDLRER